MKHLDLFSGIGGFALAARWAGWDTVAFSEIDPYACKVLEKNFPGVPNLGDIRNIGDSVACDVVTGGFPCQPFSVAGSQKAQDDSRYLWPEMRRVIALCRPSWAILENVPGLIKLGLDQVQHQLEHIGYASRAFVVPATSVGANHRRERVWIVAHSASNGCDESEVSGSDGTSNGGSSERPGQVGDPKGRGGIWPGMGGTSYPAGCWGTEPPPLRVDDGLPSRMDRNRAIGNAIVPQIALNFMQIITTC
jgi:DNA (cytosine-5)-methyltransferase 1